MFTQLSTIQDQIRRELMPLIGSNRDEMEKSIERIRNEFELHKPLYIYEIRTETKKATGQDLNDAQADSIFNARLEKAIARRRQQYEADFAAGNHLGGDMIAETFHRKLSRYTALPYETENDNLLTLSTEITRLNDFFIRIFSAPKESDFSASFNFTLPTGVKEVLHNCRLVFNSSPLIKELQTMVDTNNYRGSRQFTTPPPHELEKLKEKFPRYLQLQLVDELQEAKWAMLAAANTTPEIAGTVILIINGPPVINYLSLHNLKHRPQVWDNFIESTAQIKAAITKEIHETPLDFIKNNPKVILEFIQSDSSVKENFKSDDSYRILEFIKENTKAMLNFIQKHIKKWQHFIKNNLEWRLYFIENNKEAWQGFIKRSNQLSFENHICFIEKTTTSAADIYATTADLIQKYTTLIEKDGTFLGRTNPTLFGFRKEMEASLERFKERYIAAGLSDPNPAAATASATSTRPSTPPNPIPSPTPSTPRTPTTGTDNLMAAFTRFMEQSPQTASSSSAQHTAEDETCPAWFDVCGYLMSKTKSSRGKQRNKQLDGSFIATRPVEE